MKKIKQFAFLIYLVTYLNTSSAQPAFTAEVSQIFPSFKFKDSEGVKLNSEYQSLITGAYGIGLRFITEGGIWDTICAKFGNIEFPIIPTIATDNPNGAIGRDFQSRAPRTIPTCDLRHAINAKSRI